MFEAAREVTLHEPGCDAEDASQEAGAGGPVAAVLALVLVVLYVASVGPVAAYAPGLGVPYEVLRAVYAPVLWVCERTPLERPLYLYLELWARPRC